LYGYVQDANLIKKSIQKVYSDNSLFEGSEPTNVLVGRRITNEVDPNSALPTDSYNYITEFDDIYFGENE